MQDIQKKTLQILKTSKKLPRKDTNNKHFPWSQQQEYNTGLRPYHNTLLWWMQVLLLFVITSWTKNFQHTN